MSGDKKPEPFKRKTIRLTGWVLVKKPRQKKPETERREDVKRRINEELEIYEKCYRIFKRTSSVAIRLYASEQILQRALELRGEE